MFYIPCMAVCRGQSYVLLCFPSSKSVSYSYNVMLSDGLFHDDVVCLFHARYHVITVLRMVLK